MEELDLHKLLGDILVYDQLERGKPIAININPGTKNMIKQIFIASSEELTDERKGIRQFISEENDRLQRKNSTYYLMLEN